MKTSTTRFRDVNGFELSKPIVRRYITKDYDPRDAPHSPPDDVHYWMPYYTETILGHRATTRIVWGVSVLRRKSGVCAGCGEPDCYILKGTDQ